MKKVIVAGGRYFDDYEFMCEKLDNLFAKLREDNPNESFSIMSGCANGADSLGERYAKEHDMLVKYYPPNWAFYKMRAGHVRNEKMAQDSDYCVLFSGGNGTRNMLGNAMRYKLTIFDYRRMI